jgi:SAM-dependent methyltransferase
LFSARFSEHTFDAVTLSHVIEHVPDPLGLLVEVRRILKPGARIVLTTPNSRSLGHQKFREFWFGLDPPRHLQIFTPASLQELARRVRLNHVQAFTTAANADIFIGASLSIQSAGGRQLPPQPPPNLMRTLRSVWGQYRQHLALGAMPECGEEAVLVALKE